MVASSAAHAFGPRVGTVVDWTCTPTSLSLDAWFKLEDIHTGLRAVARDMQRRRGQARGEEIPTARRCASGCPLATVLVVLLVGPMVFFSTAAPFSSSNRVISAQMAGAAGSNAAPEPLCAPPRPHDACPDPHRVRRSTWGSRFCSLRTPPPPLSPRSSPATRPSRAAPTPWAPSRTSSSRPSLAPTRFSPRPSASTAASPPASRTTPPPPSKLAATTTCYQTGSMRTFSC